MDSKLNKVGLRSSLSYTFIYVFTTCKGSLSFSTFLKNFDEEPFPNRGDSFFKVALLNEYFVSSAVNGDDNFPMGSIFFDQT